MPAVQQQRVVRHKTSNRWKVLLGLHLIGSVKGLQAVTGLSKPVILRERRTFDLDDPPCYLPVPSNLAQRSATDCEAWCALIGVPGLPGLLYVPGDRPKRRDRLLRSLGRFVETDDLVQLLPPEAGDGEYRGRRGIALYAYGEGNPSGVSLYRDIQSLNRTTPVAAMEVVSAMTDSSYKDFRQKVYLPAVLEPYWRWSALADRRRSYPDRLRFCWTAFCRDFINHVRDTLGLEHVEEYDDANGEPRLLTAGVLYGQITRKITARLAEGLSLDDLRDRAAAYESEHPRHSLLVGA